MNEKLNDKPIEMPARGRPRKKSPGLENNIYGNDYDLQNHLYNRNNFSQFVNSCSESNSILDFIEGSSDRDTNSLGNMYPYKNDLKMGGTFQSQPSPPYNMRQSIRQDIRSPYSNTKEEQRVSEEQFKRTTQADDILDKFNKIGEMFPTYNTSSSCATDESVQISPKEVQNSKSNGRYSSSSCDFKRNSSSERDLLFRQTATPNKAFYGGQSSDFFSFNTNSPSFNESTLGDMSSLRMRDQHRVITSCESQNPSRFDDTLASSFPLDSSRSSIYDSLPGRGPSDSLSSREYDNYNNQYQRKDLENSLYKENKHKQDALDFFLKRNNYIDPYQNPNNLFENNVKRVNINTPIGNIQSSSTDRYSNSQPNNPQSPVNPALFNTHYGKQQWYPTFPNENQMPLSQFRKTLRDGESLSNSSESHIPNVLRDTMNILGANPWYNRKKRKSNPLLWQYSKHPPGSDANVMHPSKYSSLDYIQGNDSDQMYQSSLKRTHSDNGNNTVLPLFINSNKELTDEYKDVVSSFKQRIHEIDFTNVTVQQLKLFMREFGLNHTGKKNELIDRLKGTLHKLDNRNTAKKLVESKKPPETKEDEYGTYFF